MNNKNDRDIKRIFAQLRTEDEQSTPSFREILRGKDNEPSHSLPWYGLLTRPAVIILLLAVFAVPIIFNSLQGPDSISISAEFADWESPTAFLLTFNDDPTMSEIPEIEASLWEIQDDEFMEN